MHWAYASAREFDDPPDVGEPPEAMDDGLVVGVVVEPSRAT